MTLDPALMDVIACPACHGSLSPTPAVPESSGGELACAGCERVYPVRDGIPVLLIDHARQA